MTDPTPEAYAAARNAAQSVYFAHVGQPVTQAGRLVDPYARAAVDAVWPIAQQALRQHMYAAAAELGDGEVDETPALMARFEAGVRAKVAAEIRDEIETFDQIQTRGTLERAARIAEGNGNEPG